MHRTTFGVGSATAAVALAAALFASTAGCATGGDEGVPAPRDTGATSSDVVELDVPGDASTPLPDVAGFDVCSTPTTVSGTVYDPAGKRPLYDAIVYVPGAPVEPLPTGISCDQCGAPVSGSPIVSAVTGPDGRFVLANVPPGKDVPLVLQIGKWRRQVTVPFVAACKDTAMNDPGVMRLPRNRSEGDIPRIAIATGLADPFECLLRKIGVEDAEFTSDVGPGRVHLYQGHDEEGGALTPDGKPLAIPAPNVTGGSTADVLWSDLDRMKRYDLVINACEGGVYADAKTIEMRRNFADYVNAGGRNMSTHYQHYWISNGVDPLPTTASFSDVPAFPALATATIDTTFPKGEAFAQWLLNVGATKTKGELAITDPRFNVTTVHPPSTRWIYGVDPAAPDPALFHYTFNTPVGADPSKQCGKVLYSDFHVEDPGFPPAWLTGPPPWVVTFPLECGKSADMTPNDLALEFMLFDLSSCIQKDTDAPKAPR